MSRAVDDEFVVLDEDALVAYRLSGEVARVWAAVDTGVAAAREPQVESALAGLEAVNLLVRQGGPSRRAVLRGGGVVAVAGLSSIALPTAALAASLADSVLTLSVTPSMVPSGGTVSPVGVLKDGAGNGISGALVTLSYTYPRTRTAAPSRRRQSRS